MPDSILNACQPKIAEFPIDGCAQGNGRSLCYVCDSNKKIKYNLNFFHQSLYLWEPDYHSSEPYNIQKEKYEPFVEECVNNTNITVSYLFEIMGNSFEYIPYKTSTVINGITQTIDVKNCDKTQTIAFEEGDLNYALTCHKCAFDAFKKMILTIVPTDLALEDVKYIDTGMLIFI